MGATLGMARRNRQPVVVPSSALAGGPRRGERLADLPFTTRLRLGMVTGPDVDRRLVAVLRRLRDELGLV